MKQLPLLSSRLYLQPFYMLPAAHEEICAVYRNYLAGTLPAMEPEAVREDPLAAMMAGRGGNAGGERLSGGVAYAWDRELSVAVIWVEGIISKLDPDTLSGPRVAALARVDEAVEAVAALDVGSVVLYLNTPGGSAIGLRETAEGIRELAEGKRVVSYADYQCCSAGAWLAAAADECYYAESAIMGSVGTYIAALDSTRMWEMEGLKLKLFRAGELKAMGHPGKAWTKNEEEYLAGMVERHGAAFRAWMTERRPGLVSADMQGQFFEAAEAPAAFLDGFYRNLSELVAALAE